MRAFYEDVWAELPEDPKPWAWERRRALLLAEAKPGERVLDLGCGAGRFVAALQDAGADPVGVELAEAALERARRNVPGAELHALAPDGAIPLEDASVDLVVSSLAIHNLPTVADRERAIAEIARVLRPRGIVALIDIAHVGEYARALHARGCVVEQMGFVPTIFPPARELLARKR